MNHWKLVKAEKIPLSVDELLAGLAEEAAELAQAALKYRRALTQINPTPASEDSAYEMLCEEIADVELYLDQFCYNRAHVVAIKSKKMNRWKLRLEVNGRGTEDSSD